MAASKRLRKLRRGLLKIVIRREITVLLVAGAIVAQSPAPIIDRRPPPMIPERSQEARSIDQRANGVVGQVGSVDLNPAPANADPTANSVNAKSVLQKASAIAADQDANQVLKSVEQRIEEEKSEPVRKMGTAALVLGFVMLLLYGLRRWIDAVVPNPGPTPRKLRW